MNFEAELCPKRRTKRSAARRVIVKEIGKSVFSLVMGVKKVDYFLNSKYLFTKVYVLA